MLNPIQRVRLWIAVVITALIIGHATSADAQAPRVEVSALYQAMYDRSIRTRFPAGWVGDVAVHVTDAWGVIADVGTAYRTDSDLDVRLSLFTLGGGTRWSPRRASRVAPFAQLVFGLARMRSRSSFAGGEIAISQTKLVLQPAGGISLAAGRGWSITSQFGYRRIFLDADGDGDAGFNELSASAGVRFGF